jgi:molybdopterin/thiamine biosynthesis adenylyltransferase
MKRVALKTHSRKKQAVNDFPTAGESLSKVKGRNIKIVGLGGIGATLASYLARFLWSQNARSFNIMVDLIDGDHFEFRNKERMAFAVAQINKAIAKVMELADEFGDRLLSRPIPDYVKEHNIKSLIRNHDIVFLAVDNHRTRKLVSNHCEKLRDILIVSGGNDGVENGYHGTEGNIQIYERRRGKEIKNPISLFHPEIQDPQDKAPYEAGCEELAQGSAPQILFTNLAVASAMLNAFFSWLHDSLEFEEAYLDILTGKVETSCRELLRKRTAKRNK